VEKRKAFPTRIPYTTAAATRSTQAATTLTQGAASSLLTAAGLREELVLVRLGDPPT
jgi:hypothetical protein